MTKEELAEKWGQQHAFGRGNSTIDCSEDLLKDLDELMQPFINEATIAMKKAVKAIKEGNEKLSILKDIAEKQYDTIERLMKEIKELQK